MATSLTKKEKGWSRDYLETGNATKAALNNYDTTDYSTAASIGSENLKKPKVREYLASKAEKAAEFVYQLAESAEQESVRLGASKDILDRAGFKPVEKTLSVSIDAESTPRTRELADTIGRLLGRRG